MLAVLAVRGMRITPANRQQKTGGTQGEIWAGDSCKGRTADSGLEVMNEGRRTRVEEDLSPDGDCSH